MKAFEIEPKLKPDMSNFLIHMTGRDAIKSILKGGRCKDEGLIRSQVPNGSKTDSFKHKIACFTETPIFALGAFVAISKRRADEKMEYGVGFGKTYMVESKVRPTIYLDNDLLGQLFAMSESTQSEDTDSLLNSLKALAHPLGETSSKQGFTWEREWRYVDETGFYFDHKAIEVICCPKEEQIELKLILGEHAEKIRFVDSWAQYKDYTRHIEHSDSKDKITERMAVYDQDEIEEFLKGYDEYIESLREYKAYLSSLQINVEAIEKHLQELVEWKHYIDAHTASFCGHFSEEIIWRADFEETFCPDCSRDFDERLAKVMRED